MTSVSFLMCITFILYHFVPSYAADVRWLPSGGGVFEISTNWDTGVIPSDKDNVFINCSHTYDSEGAYIRSSLPLTVQSVTLAGCSLMLDGPTIVRQIDIEYKAAIHVRSASLALEYADIRGRFALEIASIACTATHPSVDLNADLIVGEHGDITFGGPGGANSLHNCRLGIQGKSSASSPITLKSSFITIEHGAVFVLGADSVSVETSDDTSSIVNHGELRVRGDVGESMVTEQLIGVPISNMDQSLMHVTSDLGAFHRVRMLAALTNHGTLRISGASVMSAASQMVNDGDGKVEITASGQLEIADGSMLNGGSFSAHDGGSRAAVLVRTALNNSGLLNVGSLELAAGSTLQTDQGARTRIGSLRVRGGTVSGDGEVVLSNGGRMTEGAVARLSRVMLQIAGTFKLAEGSLLQLSDQATIRILVNSSLSLGDSMIQMDETSLESLIDVLPGGNIEIIAIPPSNAIVRVGVQSEGSLVHTNSSFATFTRNSSLGFVDMAVGSTLLLKGEDDYTSMLIDRPIRSLGDIQLNHVSLLLESNSTDASKIAYLSVDSALLTMNDDAEVGKLRLGSRSSAGRVIGDGHLRIIKLLEMNGGEFGTKSLMVDHSMVIANPVAKTLDVLVELADSSQSSIIDCGLRVAKRGGMLVNANATLQMIGGAWIESNQNETTADGETVEIVMQVNPTIHVLGSMFFIGRGETSAAIRSSITFSQASLLNLSNQADQSGAHKVEFQADYQSLPSSTLIVGDRVQMRLLCPSLSSCSVASTVSGDGSLALIAGQWAFRAPVSVRHFYMRGGECSMMRDFTTTSSSLQGGTLSVYQQTKFDSMDWHALKLVGRPSFNSRLTVRSAHLILDSAGLELSGLAIDVSEVMLIEASDGMSISAKVEQEDLGNSSSVFMLTNDARISILANASLKLDSDGSLLGDGSLSQLVIDGQLFIPTQRSPSFKVSVLNHGVMELEREVQLVLGSEFVQSGQNASFSIGSGSLITKSSGALMLNSGSMTLDASELIGSLEVGSTARLQLVNGARVNGDMSIANMAHIVVGNDVQINGSTVIQSRANFEPVSSQSSLSIVDLLDGSFLSPDDHILRPKRTSQDDAQVLLFTAERTYPSDPVNETSNLPHIGLPWSPFALTDKAVDPVLANAIIETHQVPEMHIAKNSASVASFMTSLWTIMLVVLIS